jgi:hypothetical protein
VQLPVSAFDAKQKTAGILHFLLQSHQRGAQSVATKTHRTHTSRRDGNPNGDFSNDLELLARPDRIAPFPDNCVGAAPGGVKAFRERVIRNVSSVHIAVRSVEINAACAKRNSPIREGFISFCE